MDYTSYLRLPQLLSNQQMESAKHGVPAHDEMLFIVIHQTYELWFKQILFELDLIQEIFGGTRVDDADLGRAVHAAERIVKIEQLLVGQIDILETMTPMDFLEFRNLLMPGSGFQSEQFRLIEVRLGLKRDARLAFNGASFDASLTEDARKRVVATEAAPSLRDQVDAWLSRTPFVDMGGFHFREAFAAALDKMLSQDMDLIQAHPHLGAAEKELQLASLRNSRAMFDGLLDDKRYTELQAQGAWVFSRRALQAALFLFLYRDEPAANAAFRMLKALMDMDEMLALWRMRHALMVSRMLGRKVGTGGSAGFDYLRATADKHRAYNDLFAIATFLIPRSALPALPDEVRKSMRYRYEQST
ncbi:MAG: tryptophan 2,3-dioxygenase [Alphaproteobacteria bacterium]|nr:tryptophan 2,3-dioxygenase [Alphaproteobacteria bacterium]